MNKDIFKNLFVFEMANNHMGSVEHGLKIIREIHAVSKQFDFNFGIKLQYRHLDTFIHPDFKERNDIKYVKRFSETRLTEDQFKTLKKKMDELGFVSICTPFDEVSVNLIEKHQFDIIKIGSCSVTDWPLIERIAKTNKPIIASTAGISLDDIDKVVSFLEHRNKQITLMHCVAEYPIGKANLQLNQIDVLRKRYPKIAVGYSTHESPENTDSIKIAVAKGATIFEKHVGVKTNSIDLNVYSAAPQQIYQWLLSAKEAFSMCGVSSTRHPFTEKELNDLRGLRRGVFAKRPIKKGEKISLSDAFLAIPISEGQISANDMSKYTEFYADKDIGTNKPVLFKDTRKTEIREKVYEIMLKVQSILKESRVMIPNQLDFEISHHYGIDNFYKCGAAIINFINREYCKKIIALLPGQSHPEQYHKLKEETFNVIYGDLILTLNGVEKTYKPGDVILVEKGIKHCFATKGGVVIEEISSTHHKEDSYYTDAEILKNKNRKTVLTYWVE